MKKVLAGKSFREKLLVFGLIISVVFGGYMLFRVKPLVTDIKKTEDEYKLEARKYDRLQKETKGAKPSSTLEQELASLKKKIAAERQNLQGYDVSFIDLGNQEAKHALIADITLEAEKNQLQVLGKENEMRDLTALVSSPQLGSNISAKNNSSRGKKPAAVDSGNTLQRHVFKLKVRGTFYSTYRFIKSLQDLDNSVLIARMKLTAEDNITFQGLRLITTDLTLAI